jgi:hypothetical protein
MRKLFNFLSDWTPINRKVFWFLVSLTGLMLIPLIWAMYWGSSYAYPIDNLYQIEVINHVLQSFDHLGLNIDLTGNSYMLTGLYGGGEMQFPVLLYALLLVVVWIAVSSLLSAVTYFKLWPYNAAMLVITMILVVMRLDILSIRFLPGQVFFAVLVLSYAGLSFYFFAFGNSRPYWQRFLSFIALGAFWLLVIAFGSSSKGSLILFSHYQIVVPIALVLIFIIINGFDVPALMFRSITDSRQVGTVRGLIEFSVLSFFYLGNVVLIYLHNSNRVSWDLLYLNPFYLLIISGAVGLWNWRARMARLAWITESSHALTFIYVALYLGSVSSIAFMFSMANDSIIEVFEDAISLGYFCLGTAFYLYTLLNFIDTPSHIKLSSIMYRPKHMSLLAVNIIGLSGVMVFLFQANKFQISQGYSGYYNALGDAYYQLGDFNAARGFYHEGEVYSNWNHKSHFALGAIEIKQNHYKEAAEQFAGGTYKSGTPATFLAWSKCLIAQENEMSAIYALEDARKKGYANNPKIIVSLAYLYGKSSLKDSAISLQTQADKFGKIDEMARLNAIYQSCAKGETKPATELLTGGKNASLAIQANILAYRNFLGEVDTMIVEPTSFDTIGEIKSDKVLFYYNLALNKAGQSNNSINGALRTLSSLKKTAANAMFLKFALGYSLYQGGGKSEGLRILGFIEDENGGSGSYYTDFYGKLLLKEKAYLRAEDVFKEYSRMVNSEAFLYQSLCLSQSKFKEEALENWKSLANVQNNPQMVTLANQAIDMFSHPPLPMAGRPYSDFQVRLFLAMKGRDMPISISKDWVEILKDPSQKVFAAAQLTDEARRQNEVATGLKLFGDYINLPIAFKESKAALTMAALKLYSAAGDSKSIQELLSQDKSLPLASWQLYTFKAELAGKDTVKAIPLWTEALLAEPLDAYTVIKAASFYNSIGNEQKAYDIILQGLDDYAYQPEILKAYIIQAYNLHLDSFAEDGLKRLKFIVNEETYGRFANGLNAKEIKP